MLINQMGQTWILKIIYVLFVIVHNKHIVLIGMHTFDALASQEKFLFPPFSLELMFIIKWDKLGLL